MVVVKACLAVRAGAGLGARVAIRSGDTRRTECPSGIGGDELRRLEVMGEVELAVALRVSATL